MIDRSCSILAPVALAAVLLAACGEPADTTADAPAPAPEIAAPETVAPETVAPETVAPEIAAPETETASPATSAPEPPSAVLGEIPASNQPDIPPPSAHIAVNPGLYVSDAAELSLSALRFDLDAPERGISASGSYEVVNGVLVLAATSGETADVEFPLECRLTRVGPRLLFEDAADGSCGFLAQAQFQRETRSNAATTE